MSCWNDWDPLLEVVVGRPEHKPTTLHDEPATRQKLDVAGVGKSEWRKKLLNQNKHLLKHYPILLSYNFLNLWDMIPIK